MMTGKDLEIKACRTFICPNINIIDQFGKSLGLREDTIKKARDMTIEYIRKTYHTPGYVTVKQIAPSLLYIASMRNGDKRSQAEIQSACGCSTMTIRKWYSRIMKTLKIENTYQSPESTSTKINKINSLIEEKGKELSLEKETISDAKNLVSVYYEKTEGEIENIANIAGGSIYMASILNNDRRRQFDISNAFGIVESTVSNVFNSMLKVFRMKIIYGYNRKILRIIIEDDTDK